MARARLADGSWTRLRRGAFLATQDIAGSDDAFVAARQRALARVAAADGLLTLPHAISHQSAALLWGLPLIDRGATVHIVQASSPHSRGAPDIVRHHHVLASRDTTVLHGIRTTTLERTVLDCAMSLPAQDGLVLVDAALRLGLDRGACLERLGSWSGRRGVRKAIEVLTLADDGSESPGESRLRHTVLRVGFPTPQTQVRVPTVDGDAWGDIGWPEWHLIAEYDGRAKYAANGAAADAVLRERRREVLVEREGWRVVRATSADLRRPHALITAIVRHAPASTAASLRPRRWLA